MPQNPIDDKSKLVQVLASCRQATRHYLSHVDPDRFRHMASLGRNESSGFPRKITTVMVKTREGEGQNGEGLSVFVDVFNIIVICYIVVFIKLPFITIRLFTFQMSDKLNQLFYPWLCSVSLRCPRLYYVYVTIGGPFIAADKARSPWIQCHDYFVCDLRLPTLLTWDTRGY